MSFPPAIAIHWGNFGPELAVLITAAVTTLFALFQKNSRSTAWLAMLGAFVAAALNAALFVRERASGAGSSFGLRFLADTPSLTLNFVILLGTVLAILLSYDYLQRSDLDHPEYYPLILFSATGAMVMAASGDLITLLLGLEIMSLPVYVLSAWRQGARESEEAGMKYFLLGAFGSAILIYGAALTYGATGSFVYADIISAVTAPGFAAPLLLTLGGALVLVGLAFKAAIAPFHQWAPDVYTGAPTSVTAFMSVVVKTAAFAALVRIAATIYPGMEPWLMTTLAVLVGLTLVVGNLAALLQTGVKRMLAYSAVAHAGYLGLAVLAGPHGVRAVAWYLAAYTLMNVGAFAVLMLISDANDHGDELERFAGLGRRRPALAFAMTLFMLSLGGIPPLAGFMGKILVFQAAIASGYTVLAVIGILTSVVALVYYFRVITYMYFREPEYETPAYRSSAAQVAIWAAALGTVLMGLLPGWWYGLVSSGQELLARL
ncbi:MAG TPA: NADH-quinone oxidoreductase subunit N [Trueperaceae bacterium]|nr:NADH-quinone oxidoreductase subunit N [Trueperaceae bacterium]